MSAGFEPEPLGVGSNTSVNCAATHSVYQEVLFIYSSHYILTELVLFQKGYYNTNGTTMDNVGVRTVDLGRSILITITLFALCNFF